MRMIVSPALAVMLVCIFSQPHNAFAADWEWEVRSPEDWQFKSQQARTAVQEYKKAVKRARRQLQKDLAAAQEKAAQANELDEAVKIKRAVEMMKLGEAPPRDRAGLRQRLIGTAWTWRKNGEATDLRLIFGDNMYWMIEPKGRRGPFPVRIMRPYTAVKEGGKAEFLFDRRLKHFVLITRKGEIRTGRRIER